MKRGPLVCCWVLLLMAERVQAAAEARPPAHPDNALVDGAAMIRDWKAPVYPADALQEKIGGRTVIRIIVDEKGAISAARVLKAPDPRLGEAALAAVKLWTFSPAIENEKPIASCLDVPLNFNVAKGTKSWPPSLMTDLSNHPAPAPVTGAEPKATPPGEYPAVLSERKLSGAVAFTCRVDTQGRASAPRILRASHADFVLPALAALERWEYSPAKQGDLAIPTELVGEVSFDEIAGNRANVLAVNGITDRDGAPPAATPQPVAVADPVWPHELLMKGTSGEALVEFTVEVNGRITDVALRSASQPEFGRAALAAMASWRFKPAMSGGRAVAVPLLKRVEFSAVPLGDGSNAKDEWATLVRAARAGTIGEAGGLDEKLTPIYRVPPVYPKELLAADRPKGSADIEFVIDREGRARLPRIVSATHEEFGWSAATAIAQWVFKAPRRDGQPVYVKVRIPVQFAPPEQ